MVCGMIEESWDQITGDRHTSKFSDERPSKYLSIDLQILAVALLRIEW
jgi:hypothetical protein